MKRTILTTLTLLTLFSANAALAQFSSDMPNGSTSNGGVNGSADSGANGYIGATTGYTPPATR